MKCFLIFHFHRSGGGGGGSDCGSEAISLQQARTRRLFSFPIKNDLTRVEEGKKKVNHWPYAQAETRNDTVITAASDDDEEIAAIGRVSEFFYSFLSR